MRGTADSIDIVHGDLHPGNLLQTDGRLFAVVDLDYAKVGDGTFDLTLLALASLGVEVERGGGRGCSLPASTVWTSPVALRTWRICC